MDVSKVDGIAIPSPTHTTKKGGMIATLHHMPSHHDIYATLNMISLC